MTLGDVISDYRNKNQMSMDRFSELSGISKAYISMLERNITARGNEPSPSFEMYQAVAKAIGIGIDDLIRTVDGNVKLEATPIPASPVLQALADSVAQLNEEGQEKLVEYADDLVSSGKYKKYCSLELDQEA